MIGCLPGWEVRAADEARHAAALLKETEELDFNDLDEVSTKLNQEKRDFHHFRNRLIGERNLLNQKVRVNKDLAGPRPRTHSRSPNLRLYPRG